MTVAVSEREALIVRLWNDEGLTGTEIASRLGMERSAISGAIHRLRERGVELKARKRGDGGPAPVKQEAMVRIKPRPAPTPPEVLELTLDARQARRTAPGQRNAPFAESDGCMWPTWAGDDKTGLVCGLPVATVERGGKTVQKYRDAYCEFHHGRAVSSVKE